MNNEIENYDYEKQINDEICKLSYIDKIENYDFILAEDDISDLIYID
jgi:hypothetical protein